MVEEKLLKSEKIRLKNDKLRAQGKDPLKGWGRMVNTGLSGSNISFDNKGFIVDQQKEIAHENENKRGF